MSNPTTPNLPEGLEAWLGQLKTDISVSRQRAAMAVNTELVGLYARIGREILSRQQ